MLKQKWGEGRLEILPRIGKMCMEVDADKALLSFELESRTKFEVFKSYLSLRNNRTVGKLQHFNFHQSNICFHFDEEMPVQCYNLRFKNSDDVKRGNAAELPQKIYCLIEEGLTWRRCRRASFHFR